MTTKSMLSRAAAASLMAACAASPTSQAWTADVFAVAEAGQAVRDWGARRDALWLVGQVVALALPALLLVSGWGARLRSRLDRLTKGRPLLTASLLAGVYAALFIAANLPVAAARQLLAEPFGLAAPDWTSWAVDRVGSAAPLLLGSLLLGWAPYLLLARSPRLWPMWAGVIFIALLSAALLAQPAQHDLQPVDKPELQAAIDDLTRRANAPGARVAIRTAERAGRCGGGTMLGLGPTKVLAIDTALLQHHPEREVAQVIAHELGHYIRGDDRKALYVGVALILCGLAALRFGAGWALRMSDGRWGFSDIADPASFPLLVFILTLFGLVGSAGFHAYGRQLEQRADQFSLELTGDGMAQAALMQRYLACSRWSNPDTSWVQRTFRQNHPSFRSRIEAARASAHRVSVSHGR